ncbi:uncharacterized protein A4U43_C06F7580 [Asparagus officinalis]|uniref:Uncharacterized protein n=1 Tax=Asparagus officinalis TaxID=4686 RepID=A0A5P1ENM7_ASPOF|nr:uncharacterized protein A4U43_C06F7580 [Asparagus officinalis]
MSTSSSHSSESARSKPEITHDIRISCNIRGYCTFMDGIAPRMRAEHWRAYGSSNFKNYVSFGPIPADKATIMLLLDHLDLATGKFFFKDSQTRTPQAYTFDVNWDEAYEKLVMLNEAYEQALVARGVDILAIKAETEKKFAEEKRIRQNKGEPQIDEALSEGDQTREMDIELEEAKVEAEKEEGKGEEGGKEGDQTQAMGSEQEKKGRKRREGGDDTLKVFVSGLRAKSQRTTKKPKFLESPFQTELPKKRRKGKKGVVVVEDDDDKGEKDEGKPLAISHLGRSTSVAELWKREKSEEEKKKGRKGKKGVVVVGDDDDKGEKDEGKPLAVSHLGRSTSVAELWKREKSEEEKKLLETLNMGIPSSQDFDVRLPGTINEGFYHNFTVEDIPDVSADETVEDIPDVLADENKWLQHFLTLKVDNRTIFEVEDHTICRYDMLHLLRGGRLKDEIIEALVASLRTWLKLPINAHVERKYAIVTSYFSAILEGREVMDIEVLHRESHMLRAGLAAQIICEGREWKKLRLKLDSDDPEYLLYFGGSDAPMIEWKY